MYKSKYLLTYKLTNRFMLQKEIVSPVNIKNNRINKLILLRIKIMKINIEKVIQ